MASRRAASKAGLRVDIPAPGADRPQLGRVGIIAVVGFAIGMLWPRLAGVKMVPSPPADEGDTVAAAEPAASASAGPGDAPPASRAEPAEPEPSKPPPAADRVKISEAKITSCRDREGKKRSACGELEDLDRVTRARIQTLGACSGAEKAHGTLSLGLELDLQKKKVVDLQRGKSTTLPDADAKALMRCAVKEFEAASLDGLKAEHAQYTVFYIVELVPPSEANPAAAEAEPGAEGEKPGGQDVTAASGRATVSWDVAIIRSEPKEGEIVARILRGTRVVVTGRQDDWYRIKYDSKGSEGWVFRGAIGL